MCLCALHRAVRAMIYEDTQRARAHAHAHAHARAQAHARARALAHTQ